MGDYNVVSTSEKDPLSTPIIENGSTPATTTPASELEPSTIIQNGFSTMVTATPPATIKQDKHKVYKIRWVILCLFVMYSMSNAVQWIQYSIIANIVMKYYNISSYAVDWTSMIYMISYIPLIFPASWLLNKLVSTFYIASA